MSDKKYRAPDRDVRGKAIQRVMPIRHPPDGTTGMPRRLFVRGDGVDITKAQGWARQQPWFRHVIAFCKKAPCSTTKYYYWILKEEPAT